MKIMVIDFPNPDWILIRQALSLSLLKNVPITIGGGAAFIAGNPDFKPILDDMARMAEELGAGRLTTEAESIIFEPHPLLPGTFRFDSSHLSSAVELLLFLMPALFHADFRSVLELGGVTHSPLSCPTVFVKETLLAALEQMGLYGSLTLRRFGFHGSGGGAMESRIYPREQRSGKPGEDGDAPAISGVKIFISHLDTGLAEIEKGLIAEKIGMDPNRIAIIEVMESDGPGNGVQVVATSRGLPVVLFREMKLYDGKGELAFSEETLRSEIAGLAGETRLLLEGTLPERAIRELYPYCVMSGTAAPAGETPGAVMTRELCGKLF
jgi:RNA 3'-terminal phosphate cyclase